MNSYQRHLLIVPEDDANRQLALGFVSRLTVPRAYSIENVAGGWAAAKDRLVRLTTSMRKYPLRHVLLLVDFDSDEGRRDYILKDVAPELKDRSFVIGVFSEPETLKKELKGRLTLWEIGQKLGSDCVDNADELWSHSLLLHNASELARLRDAVLPFLLVGSSSDPEQ